jgi:methionyl-tRNA synthetase
MIEKYCDGVIPAPANGGELAELLSKTVSTADNAMCALDFQGGILAIMDFCKRINLYVTETEPWVLAKDSANKAKLEEVLYNTAEGIRALAVLLHPVMPETCEKLWDSLGANTLGSISEQKIGEVANWGTLPAGSKVSKSAPLFPRLEE